MMMSHRWSAGLELFLLADTQLKVVQLQQPDRRYETQQVEEHARTEPQHRMHQISFQSHRRESNNAFHEAPKRTRM